jgi:Transglycosylase SLT domain
MHDSSSTLTAPGATPAARYVLRGALMAACAIVLFAHSAFAQSGDLAPIVLQPGNDGVLIAQQQGADNRDGVSLIAGKDGAAASERGAATHAHLEILVRQIAREMAFNEDFAVLIAKLESRFDPDAISEEGAMGLMQLMPDTAREFGVKDPFDPEQNIRGSIRYLKQLTAEFGHPLLVAAAYHSGPQTVRRTRGIPKGPRMAAYTVAILNDFYGLYDLSKDTSKRPPATIEALATEALAAGYATGGTDTAVDRSATKDSLSNLLTDQIGQDSDDPKRQTSPPDNSTPGTWEGGFVLHLD